jgi:methionyl-tRNA formyltransferase
MIVEVLADLPAFDPIPQPDDGTTYAPKIRKEEARIDWSRPAKELVRHIQGLAPFPGAWFEHGGERIKLLAAEGARGHGEPGEVLDDRLTVDCGNGSLRPTLVQRAGKGMMVVDELLRGFPIPAGTILK